MHNHRRTTRTLTALIALALIMSVAATYSNGQPLATTVSAAAVAPAAADMNPALSPPWSAAVLVSQGTSYARGPGLAMNQGEAVVDYDLGQPVPQLYAAVSPNNGHSFNSPAFRACTNGGIPASTPVQAAEGSDRYVYLLWSDSCDPGEYRTLWLNVRDPNGNWLGARELSNVNSNGGSVAVGPDGSVHIVYVHVISSAPDYKAQVLYIKSTNHGSNFSTPYALDDAAYFTNQTSVTVDTAGHVFAVYERGPFNNYQIYARESIQGVWQTAVDIYTGRGFWPHVAATSDGRVGAVWQENDSGVQVYYKRWSPSGGWDPVVTNISNNSSSNFNPTNTYDAAGNVYVSWTLTDGSGVLYTYYTYELSPGVFSTPQLVNDSRATGLSQASWNNNLGMAYQNDGTGNWLVYFRWIQLTPPATATPTKTPTPLHPTATPTFCPNQTFVDVNCSYWAFSFIKAMNDANIINGYAANSSQCAAWQYICYLPHNLVTRAEVTKMLARAENWAAVTPTSQSFSDVPPSYWAYGFIERAVANGAADGLSQSQCQAAHVAYPCFQPNSPLTRAQLTKFVYRAAHPAPYTPTTPDFTDVPASNFAYLYIETAAHNNIVSGYTTDQCGAAHAQYPCFLPNQNVHRDEVAKIIKRMLDSSVTNTPTAAPTDTPTNTNTPAPLTNTPLPVTNTPAQTATPMPTSTPQGPVVTLGDDTYTPQTITITVGTVVQWTNGGNMTHTVTSDPSATEAFTSGNLTNGQSYSHMFTTAGTDGYHCDYHGGPGSGMYGTVVVLASAQPQNLASAQHKPDEPASY